MVITGTGFSTVTQVRFGTLTAAHFTVTSSTSITALTEPHTSGVVSVSVIAPTGTGNADTAFTYVDVTTTLYVTPFGTGTACLKSAPCPTIQGAITRAESQTFATSGVTITVGPGTYAEHGTITATSLYSLSIEGAGSSLTTVTGTTNGRPFTVTGGTVAISGLTITHGSTSTGGGVFNGGTLTLTDDAITNDNAYYWYYGGAVDNYGVLTMTGDTVSGDSGYYGGAVTNWGTATLTNDTFAGDTGAYGGVGLNWGTATLTNDTISNDNGYYGYGGVSNFSGTLTVSNSVLEGAGCTGTIIDGGHNVASDDTCAFGPTSLNTSSTLNLATTLAPNGSTGPETLAIGTTSSAFEEVPATACTPSTDERGDSRPGVSSQTRCDAGAFELQGTQPVTSITSVAPTLGIASGGTTVTITGLNLLGTSAVHFGTTTAASFTVVGSTEIRAKTEPHSNGTVAVSVTTPSATVTDPHAFTYVTSTTTLYVTPFGTGTACVKSAPCPTIQSAITRAESQTFTTKAVTITVAPGTYAEHDTITATTLHSLTIEGAGSSLTTVTGTTNGRPFTVTGGTVTISGIQVSKGYATTGAAVSNAAHATLTLTGDTFANNDNDYYDYYGSVYNAGTLTATNDTFTASSGYYGGGIANLNGGNATVTNDTFADDNGYVYGGGVSNWGTATVTDDTFANDTSVYHYGSLNGFSGTLTVSNSILEGASCSGTIIDGGHNVASDDTCAFGPTSLNTSSTLNLATTLAPNGSTGPETLAIGTTSSAFEEVPATACTPSTDERGDSRPGVSPQTRCDAGAFELQGTQPVTSITSVAPTLGIASGGTTVTITGLNLLGTSAVHFGTTTAASFTVVGSTEIRAKTEPHSNGTVAVSVTTPSATVTDPHAFTYVTSTTTLYVTPFGTGTACVKSAPCPTIQSAITRAESQTFTTKAVTITVAPGTYAEHDTITATTLHSLTIEGAGSSLTTVTGTTNGRPFTVTGGTVTISGIQVSKGYAATGAAVSNAAHATLTLTGDTFANNDNDYYDYYGSVYNAGTLTATNDTFTASSGYYGGGIANLNGGNATVTNDTFADDNGYVYGGGVSNWGTATSRTTPSPTTKVITTTMTLKASRAHSRSRTRSSRGPAARGIIDGGHNVASDDSCAFGPTSLNTSTTLNLAATLASNGSTGPRPWP